MGIKKTALNSTDT